MDHILKNILRVSYVHPRNLNNCPQKSRLNETTTYATIHESPGMPNTYRGLPLTYTEN